MHADMIVVDQFPNLEVNRDKASQGFHHSRRGGFEGSQDPDSRLPLDLGEFFHGALDTSAIIVHKRIPYNAIGITHDLYNNRLCFGFSPWAEFPRESIALVAERTLRTYHFECSLKRSF